MARSAALGLAVTTGQAVVVVLCGTVRSPEIAARFPIALADPWVRESLHPYHEELGETGRSGELARKRGCEAASRATAGAVRRLLADMRAHGLEPHGAALVVRSLADPARVNGAHARAHAAELALYRSALEHALAEGSVPVRHIAEKSLRAEAAARLERSPRELDAELWRFVDQVGTPWRAPEKRAALAAWLALPKRGERDAG